MCHQVVGLCGNQTLVMQALDEIASTFDEGLYCEHPSRGCGFHDPMKSFDEPVSIRSLNKSLLYRMLSEHDAACIFLTSDLEGSPDGQFDPSYGLHPSIGVQLVFLNILSFYDDNDEHYLIPIKSTKDKS
jgi:hypothetical protein